MKLSVSPKKRIVRSTLSLERSSCGFRNPVMSAGARHRSLLGFLFQNTGLPFSRHRNAREPAHCATWEGQFQFTITFVSTMKREAPHRATTNGHSLLLLLQQEPVDGLGGFAAVGDGVDYQGGAGGGVAYREDSGL